MVKKLKNVIHKETKKSAKNHNFYGVFRNVGLKDLLCYLQTKIADVTLRVKK